ncbi:unnamed protein product, partial [Schistosoma curassoni]|uniref:Endo/exonuclease/phosphatase domain-containing protein n=1 Tax=Schistosoma curassoni TaxID=6186 RepID=A0A183L000_9TREM
MSYNYEIESLASSLSKHDDLKQEIKTLSPLKLPLSKDIVPAELDDIIKAESVIDFIANEVTKRIVSRNNVIVYNIPDRIPIKTVRNSILKASNLHESPCQCIRPNKKHQKYSCPVLFRFDSHILAEQLKESERLICALTKFRNARIVSDKTTNQRLTQKCTLNENKGVEITTNHDASAAGSTDAATLSHVLQYSDIPTKSANLPVMSVVTSDSQCTSNDATNPILPSLPLEAHKQVLDSNAKTLKNTVKTKKPMPPFLAKPSFILITETWCSQAVSDSELNIQNYLLYRCDREIKRGGGWIIYALDTLTTNKVEDSVLNSLPESVWISVNTLNHSLHLGCIYRAPDSSNNENDLIINAFIHASSLNFNAKVITGDFNYPGINWSTGSCQSCNDEFSATINMHCWSQFSKPYELYIPARYRNKLRRLQNRYFKSNDFTVVAQIKIIFNQIKEKHRLKAINEELLALNTNSKAQKLTLLFNKRAKATRNVDIPCIQHNNTFIYDSKTIADLFS